MLILRVYTCTFYYTNLVHAKNEENEDDSDAEIADSDIEDEDVDFDDFHYNSSDEKESIIEKASLYIF